MIRVLLPAHLKNLAHVDGEVTVAVSEPVSANGVIDAIEASYPMLRGTIRDPVTGRRRPFVRFFIDEEDHSHDNPDQLLPDAVREGRVPFIVVGAMAGG
ncbi:MAG: MoaD/ThiS family protein [Acidobacteriota bacterium]|nr:MoaD/ThiS family protein [Acidobacteriota bacterium]MDE3043253.1 MoaD/ThiS family protein [Acidobacteriota bacterium]MDE3106575.1 MoaD/ThiS family protein [Acidobacteriota bacterium]MDE3222188.1 MoaD/ThiS family protein [Acidobacteriota bacterium]